MAIGLAHLAVHCFSAGVPQLLNGFETMSNLERRWWFFYPVLVLSWLAAIWLCRLAGVSFSAGSLSTLAPWVIFILCAESLRRALSLGLWFLILLVSPAFAKQGA